MNYPAWARPDSVDRHGNVMCAKCGAVQAPSWSACTKCCPHDELRFTEEWIGSDDYGGWALDVECAVCGKGHDFPLQLVKGGYKAVRK